MKRALLTFIILVLVSNALFASITFSGSARLRPRYDLIINKTGDQSTHSGDIYFQYRAKLNIHGSLGDNFYFKGQISHNSPANWSKMGDGSDLPSASSDASGQSPSIAFTEINLGYKGEKWAYKLGRFSYGHNTLLDIHYYPTKLVDIPFFIFNNNAITGAELSYNFNKHYLKAALSIDENHINYQNFIDAEVDSVVYDQEGITAMFNAGLKFDNIKINPSFLISGGKSMSNPITAGVVAQYAPSGLLLKAEAAYSVSDHAKDLYAYNGMILRTEVRKKIGMGTLRLMYDHSRMSYSRFNGQNYATSQSGIYHYTWLEYTMPLFKSEFGSVVLRPVWRCYYSRMEATDKEYTRHKIELFLQYTF
ncbi:MAG: hypothetical protein WCT23_03610 [Candidatus Neomarinimicrobiota bacterium]